MYPVVVARYDFICILYRYFLQYAFISLPMSFMLITFKLLFTFFLLPYEFQEVSEFQSQCFLDFVFSFMSASFRVWNIDFKIDFAVVIHFYLANFIFVFGIRSRQVCKFLILKKYILLYSDFYSLKSFIGCYFVQWGK